jgi:hypothetical protein
VPDWSLAKRNRSAGSTTCSLAGLTALKQSATEISLYLPDRKMPFLVSVLHVEFSLLYHVYVTHGPQTSLIRRVRFPDAKRHIDSRRT